MEVPLLPLYLVRELRRRHGADSASHAVQLFNLKFVKMASTSDATVTPSRRRSAVSARQFRHDT